MEFDENVARLQGTLYSLGSVGKLNEAGSVQEVVAALERVICKLPESERAKLTFFMVLNTRLSVSEKLKGDELVGLFTNITPYIEKEYLITYVYRLSLQLELFRVIENCPGAVGVELLEDVMKKLKEGSFHRDDYGIEHLYHLWESVFVKICKIDKGLHLNCHLDKFLCFFQDIYDLIKKVVVTSMKVEGLEMFVGCHLYNFLKAVLFCLKAAKEGNLADNPIYKLGIHLDTNECDVENPIKVCFQVVFDEIFNILEHITVELWVTLSECHLDSDATDSAQTLIGDLVYKILQEVKEFDVPPQVLNCLSSLAINKRELMSRAGVDEIISKIEGEGRAWFEALVNHSESLEKKSVECLISHLDLAGAEELTTILRTSYEYLCKCKENENLDLVKELFVGALKRAPDSSRWLEKVFEAYRPNLVRRASTGDEVIEAFNKMSKDRSVSDGDLICLCVQSPFDTIKGICRIGVDGSQGTEFVTDALELVKCACSVSVSEGVPLIDCVLLSCLEEDLSERETQSFVNLVVLLARRKFLGASFSSSLLARVKKYLEKERFKKGVVSLEIVKVLLEAKLLDVEIGAFLVFMCQVLEQLTWDLGSFSGAKAEGRDLAARIVASALSRVNVDEKGGELRWAREEMGKSWEGNRAHFWRLWPRGDWVGEGKFTSVILALAHSHRNAGDSGKILTGVGRPSEVRASVVLSLFVLLPVLSFTEWNLIFDGLRIGLEKGNSEKSAADLEQDVLDLFGSSLHLLTLSLKFEEKGFPSYKYCLRNFLRLTKRCFSEMNEASLLGAFERIVRFLGMIEDEGKRESCEEMSSPVLAELTGLLRNKCGTEGRRAKEPSGAEDAVAVAPKGLRRKAAFEGRKRIRAEVPLRNDGRTSAEEAHESEAGMDFVKVVLLGGAGVGKTSIVQRFVRNEFSEKYAPTEQKETYYPSVIINDHLYELKISDIPVISYFPVNSYYEWADFRFYGLRSATAYILVFDLSNVETFQFIRTMREQMMESRDMKHVPLLIVGNKQDLIAGDAASASGPSPPSGNSLSNHLDHNQRKRRDIVNLVKKHWKCNYVECSAKHNWGVIAVFKELMEVIDSMDPNKNHNREVYSSPMIDNIHDAFDGNKCVIL